MNPRQKKIFFSLLSIIVLALAAWFFTGREFFTKTRVLVEKRDELFPDMIEKVWTNKFIWGLDLTAALSFVALLTGGFLIYRYRDKK
jgi:hypothetical protein